MIPRIAPAQIALLTLCFLMAALTVYELSVPPAEFVLPVVHLRPSIAGAQPPPAFLAPPPESFSAINDRPVFIPSRKPLALPADKTANTAATAPPLPALALVGVILDGQNSLAMVKPRRLPGKYSIISNRKLMRLPVRESWKCRREFCRAMDCGCAGNMW